MIDASHYKLGRKFEPWDVIYDWGLNFFLGNVAKYIARAGLKLHGLSADPTEDSMLSAIQDLEKAMEYLRKEVEIRKRDLEEYQGEMRYSITPKAIDASDAVPASKEQTKARSKRNVDVSSSGEPPILGDWDRKED